MGESALNIWLLKSNEKLEEGIFWSSNQTTPERLRFWEDYECLIDNAWVCFREVEKFLGIQYKYKDPFSSILIWTSSRKPRTDFVRLLRHGRNIPMGMEQKYDGI